jgi:hypothetical protein
MPLASGRAIIPDGAPDAKLDLGPTSPWHLGGDLLRVSSDRDRAVVKLLPTAAARYLTSESILNIGRYIAITMTPTMQPTRIIISGSTIDVSDWIAASTSSS